MIIWFLSFLFFGFFMKPLQWFARFLSLFLPFLKQRNNFEKKNFQDKTTESFKNIGVRADLCFEFSSEGEYQQVASLIEDSLVLGKKIELVYFSPSVEKTITELALKYPQNIRVLRYSLLYSTFSSWVTSQTLILVRYDLFPEFFIWSLKPGHKLKMIWVTFKKERLANKTIPLFKRFFLWRSSHIVFASEADAELAKRMNLIGSSFDFRIEQIRRRLIKKDQTFKLKFPAYSHLKKVLTETPVNKRIIFGNVWPEDIFLLEKLPSDYKCLLIPHKLDQVILHKMTDELTKLRLSYQLVTDDFVPEISAQIIILVKKGILCESFGDFSKAYVGGGFGESIHSILEPLVAGCGAISCGPVNFRSTEFDIAESMNKMTVVKNSQEFYDWLIQDFAQMTLHDKLKTYFESYPDFMKDLLSC